MARVNCQEIGNSRVLNRRRAGDDSWRLPALPVETDIVPVGNPSHAAPVGLVPVMVLTGWQLVLGSIPIGIVALAIADSPWFLPSWQSIAVIAWITLIPMCIGNVCWFAIVGLLPANVAGLSSVMVPVVAMVSGAIVHGEPLGPLQLVSMGSCVAALVLALGHKTRPATREG